jgi:EAL domain-containing protein (putative c-di-GMP-specific phosphodiesterase class I)
MQTILTTVSTWFLVARDPEPGMPPRIPVTPPFRIGRREGFDLCLNCRNVSGLHAELIVEGDQLKVEDLNSTNGTFVNGEKIREKTVLKDGDTIQFGKPIFTVSNTDQQRPMPTIMLGEDAEATQETTEDRFARLLAEGVVPHFQPIVDIVAEPNIPVAYEVLGRSRLFGLKTPEQMFAVATDLEKEAELSRALRIRGIEAAESTLKPGVKLFVNTHPAELDCEEIKRSLEQIRSKFPARQIMLELPEMVLYAPEEYDKVFRVARELKVRLVLHDFGAGQIQLTELHRMNPDIIKFDCALTQGIDGANRSRQSLVSAMVKMTKELGITPMAEYVESESEHKVLKQLGFQLAQGYFYGRPTAIEDIKVVDSKETVSKANKKPQRPLASLKNEDATFEVAVKAIQTEAEESIKVDHKDSQWILQQDPETLTLQLMFTSKLDGAKSFVAQQEQPGDYAIYRKWSSKREWYVVIYGIYKDRAEAKADTTFFSGTAHTTWIRKMSEIHTEVHSVEDAD